MLRLLNTLNISKRERNILLAIFALLFAFAIYSFLFQPLAEKVSILNKEIESKELKLKKNRKILLREQGVSADFAKYEKFFSQNSSDEQEKASILSEIDSVAHQVGIRINDMKPRTVKRIDFYNIFGVDIECEGTLPTITKFIYSLQNQPHLLRTEKLRLEKQAVATSGLKAFLMVSKVLIP